MQMHFNGEIIHNGDAGFDRAIMDTMFNKADPGRRPHVLMRPKTIDDIIHAVHYAKAHGKKVSVCSGGHSWSANHLRNDSVLIDLCHFNQYEINRDSMTALAGPAVGGSILLKALVKQGLFFPAGHCKGVAIGGYLLQGGYAWNGRKLGMACESVLGIDVVTANGEYLFASETENPDLFWAARGAGSGFFGVVVRFHLKLYPCPKYTRLMVHAFGMKYLEDVFRWVHEVGPSVMPAVEFQMVTSRRNLLFLGPGIEATATIFADTKDELHLATDFMRNSPIKKKAYLCTPCLPTTMNLLYSGAMTHYPANHHWAVDNMWTHAPINELMPYIKQMAATLPPPPAHFLWLNWYPPQPRPDMAHSIEDNIYIALYGGCKNVADTKLYENWASDWMKKMEHLATGVQLADEGLHRRTARFVTDSHLQKLDTIRTKYDPDGLFNAWHSRLG